MPLLAVVLLGAGCVGIDDPDGWGAPVESDGAIYLTVDSGELIAVEAESYDLIWEFPDADQQECGDEGAEDRDLDGIYAAPVIVDDVVYFGAWDGNVYALDSASGECLWDFETNDPIIGGVVVDGGRVYAASTDENLYVIDAESGEEIDSRVVGEVWSSPLLLDGTLYVGTMDGDLRGIDPETLDDAWDAPFDSNAGLLTDPLAVDGIVVVGGIGGTLYALDAATGQEEWTFDDADGWFWGTPVVDEDGAIIYATNMDNSVYAIDAATGAGIWEFQGEALFRAGPALANGTVVAVDDDGFVFGLESATGELIWNPPTELEESTFARPLVLDENTVFIVARNGDVFTVDVETGGLRTIEVGS